MTLFSVRHAGKPLLQPTYNFRDVPWATKDLMGSVLSEVTDRQHFVDSIGEFTLLCNEASRRRNITSSDTSSIKKTSTKPLSIEYIFDRMDTDDPIWGYMVRTDTPMSAKGRVSNLKASPQWRRGMLQGFVTVTTFTTWKSTFRFDSLHDEAFSYDDVELELEMRQGLRAYDKDGTLAQNLESTVHGGDPYNEGIVYPRIAEVSLLGGLGCGKQLLKLVIERLECQRGTSSKNYDYIVLQATENSISFYESMGFVRVGCIQGRAHSPPGFTSSPIETYVVEKEWEKPIDIAKQYGVDVLDIEFLNAPVWGPTFRQNVWLKKGTVVFVPLTNKAAREVNNIKNSSIEWYTAKENETPRGIAKKLHLDFDDFLTANKRRYPELLGASKLKDGTRVQISRFDIDDSDYMPYPHWTFPDDDFESNEPSYMMALKLNRKFGKDAKLTPVADSLCIPIVPYSPDDIGLKELLIEPKVKTMPKGTKTAFLTKPKKPKRPSSAYLLFCNDIRSNMGAKLDGKAKAECFEPIRNMWKSISEEEKAQYYKQHYELKTRYDKAIIKYENDLLQFRRENPHTSTELAGIDTSLLEKVVTLISTDGLPGYVSKYDYFYVLTYIPDLQWVHLIPMKKVGTFDGKHPQSCGRPIWMIVDEQEGMEFDTSAAMCKPIVAHTMNNSADADDEQWDICECKDSSYPAPISLPKTSTEELMTSVMKPKASDVVMYNLKDRYHTLILKPNKPGRPSISSTPPLHVENSIQLPRTAILRSESKKNIRSVSRPVKNMKLNVLPLAAIPKSSPKKHEKTQVLSDTAEAPTQSNKSKQPLIALYLSGTYNVMLRIQGKIVEMPKSPQSKPGRTIAPLFLNKSLKKRPLCSQKTPRKIQSGRLHINTKYGNNNEISPVVSDDALSDISFVEPQRKRIRSQS